MNLTLLVTAAICLIGLGVRFLLFYNPKQRSTFRQRWKTARVLIAALLALMAITMRMRRMSDRLDGKQAQGAPTFFEKILERH